MKWDLIFCSILCLDLHLIWLPVFPQYIGHTCMNHNGRKVLCQQLTKQFHIVGFRFSMSRYTWTTRNRFCTSSDWKLFCDSRILLSMMFRKLHNKLLWVFCWSLLLCKQFHCLGTYPAKDKVSSFSWDNYKVLVFLTSLPKIFALWLAMMFPIFGMQQ